MVCALELRNVDILVLSIEVHKSFFFLIASACLRSFLLPEQTCLKVCI